MRYRVLVMMNLALAATVGGCASPGRPLVIAHRGASAYLPEHTLEAYALGYGMGADAIEPDVVLTRDGVPVCSHDLTIHNEAAVAARFPDRRRADGKWYIIDFDVAELKGLGAALGRNGEHGAGMQLATLEELVVLVGRLNESVGRRVELVVELKAAAFHRDAGKPMEAAVLDVLRRHGCLGRADGAIMECFELESLRRMRRELGCDLRLVYLVSDPISDAVLDEVAGFADGIGPSRKLVREDDGTAGKQPDVIEKARERGLSVYVWTFGRDAELVRRFMRMPGVTGVFTDNPDVAIRARD